LVLREKMNNHKINFNVVGFIDDDPLKQKYRIHGIPVLGKTENLSEIKQKYIVEDAIIAIPSASQEAMNRIVNKCKNAGLEIRTLPAIKGFMEVVRLN